MPVKIQGHWHKSSVPTKLYFRKCLWLAWDENKSAETVTNSLMVHSSLFFGFECQIDYIVILTELYMFIIIISLLSSSPVSPLSPVPLDLLLSLNNK